MKGYNKIIMWCMVLIINVIASKVCASDLLSEWPDIIGYGQYEGTDGTDAYVSIELARFHALEIGFVDEKPVLPGYFKVFARSPGIPDNRAYCFVNIDPETGIESLEEILIRSDKLYEEVYSKMDIIIKETVPGKGTYSLALPDIDRITDGSYELEYLDRVTRKKSEILYGMKFEEIFKLQERKGKDYPALACWSACPISKAIFNSNDCGGGVTDAIETYRITEEVARKVLKTDNVEFEAIYLRPNLIVFKGNDHTIYMNPIIQLGRYYIDDAIDEIFPGFNSGHYNSTNDVEIDSEGNIIIDGKYQDKWKKCEERMKDEKHLGFDNTQGKSNWIITNGSDMEELVPHYFACKGLDGDVVSVCWGYTLADLFGYFCAMYTGGIEWISPFPSGYPLNPTPAEGDQYYTYFSEFTNNFEYGTVIPGQPATSTEQGQIIIDSYNTFHFKTHDFGNECLSVEVQTDWFVDGDFGVSCSIDTYKDQIVNHIPVKLGVHAESIWGEDGHSIIGWGLAYDSTSNDKAIVAWDPIFDSMGNVPRRVIYEGTNLDSTLIMVPTWLEFTAVVGPSDITSSVYHGQDYNSIQVDLLNGYLQDDSIKSYDVYRMRGRGFDKVTETPVLLDANIDMSYETKDYTGKQDDTYVLKFLDNNGDELDYYVPYAPK